MLREFISRSISPYRGSRQRPYSTGSLFPAFIGALLAVVSLNINAGIEETKHNLARKLGEDIPTSSICIFCHTPHGEAETAMIPMWVPSSDRPDTFVTFDTLGRSLVGKDSAVGTVSVACLSCHDETQALGVTSLTFDHPFGVAYLGNRSLSETAPNPEATPWAPAKKGTRAIDRDQFQEADQAIIDGKPIWWVDTGEEGRQRHDIQLFSRLTDDGAEAIPFIECATCHDPHNSNITFLRVSNNGSRLCLTCHVGK